MGAFFQETFGVPAGGDEQSIILLRALADVVTSIQVDSVAIANGGSGYVAGDVLELSGGDAGTALYAARFIVTSVNAGVIDGVRVESCGAYTTAPNVTSAGITTTGGTGSNATLTVTTQAPYLATPDAANDGSGYVVGDIFAVDGFTGTTDPQFRVTEVSAGAVVAASQHTLGSFAYDEIPSTTSTTTAQTGAGDDALQVDISNLGWQTQDRTDTDNQTDFQWIVRGTNLAGADPYVGIKTFTESGNPQWNLAGQTGYNAAETFEGQPGSWPGYAGATPGSSGGVRVPLALGGTFELFIHITGRRFISIMRQSPAYEMIYCGLFTPFIDNPVNKYPLPLIIGGASTGSGATISSDYSNASTPHATIAHHAEGHVFYRWLDGSWRELEIDNFSAGKDNFLWPYFQPLLDNPADQAPNIQAGSGTLSLTLQPGTVDDGILNSSTTGSNGPQPLPKGLGDSTSPLVPYTLVNDTVGSGVSQIVGEIEGLFSVSGQGLSAEDRLNLPNGDRVAVFPSINSTEINRFYAINEA